MGRKYLGRALGLAVAARAVLGVTGMAPAGIVMETVPVGNAGNAADPATGNIFGAVNYDFNIGKYEVTAGQYTAFLNAVAMTDPYGLYSPGMSDVIYRWGCGIQRYENETTRTCSYSIAPDLANRPVNYVSFWDACRFANWLNNGQQGPGSTETGAYSFIGFEGINASITRITGATWAVASENEWYKAAYYDPNKSGSPGYWMYATGTDTISTDMANYGNVLGHTTDGGSYAYPSPYGTFDQSGNITEWNEAIRDDFIPSCRQFRDACFIGNGDPMRADFRYYGAQPPWVESFDLGFRVVQLSVTDVPEPASLGILGLAAVGMLVGRRRTGR